MHSQTPLNHDELRQFTGDPERYRHSVNRRVLYTPGVQHLAERGNAYWLIDAIASYLGSPQLAQASAQDERLEYLQFWRLEVQGKQAVLTCRADSDVAPAIRQDIKYTDFPMSHIDVWVGNDGSQWTLYLPSEH